MQQVRELLFQLIRCEICGDSPDPALFGSLSEEEWISVLRFAKKHETAHLVSDAALRFFSTDNSTLTATFKRYKYVAVSHNVRLTACLKKCSELLTAARVPFIFLKGSVLRNYYPETWMRTSADIDVLIPEDRFEETTRILSAAEGFRYRNMTPHDVSFSMAEGIVLELHHSLIEAGRIGKAEQLLNDIWSYTETDEGIRYRLTDEMFYYYHLAHMAKHIENGGCGIRPFIDLWLLNHKLPENPARSELLKEGGLDRFAYAVNTLSEYWFGDGSADENTLILERFILEGGVFGTKENAAGVKSIKLHGKAGYMLQKIWMPYPYLCCQYPELKGRRALQPVYEVRRWMRIVFRGNIGFAKQELELTKKASAQLPQTKKMWRYLGF